MNNDNIIIRRAAVIMNYASLVTLAVTFEWAVNHSFNDASVITLIVSAITLIISFIPAYARSGFWKFAHMPAERLDERELRVSGNILRISYAIFAILAVILFYLFSLAEIFPSIVLGACILYFAHVLPASALAWTEKEKWSVKS